MKPTAILATIPSDAHNWNLIYMDLFLQEQGFKVANLGPCTPIDLLLDSCDKIAPELVVISTINGHGHIEAKDIIVQFQKKGLLERSDIYLGGKLSTDPRLSYLYAIELEEMGYDKVFSDQSDLSEFSKKISKYFKAGQFVFS